MYPHVAWADQLHHLNPAVTLPENSHLAMTRETVTASTFVSWNSPERHDRRSKEKINSFPDLSVWLGHQLSRMCHCYKTQDAGWKYQFIYQAFKCVKFVNDPSCPARTFWFHWSFHKLQWIFVDVTQLLKTSQPFRTLLVQIVEFQKAVIDLFKISATKSIF